MLAEFLAVIGHSWDLDETRNGTELLDGAWVKTASKIMYEFSQYAHPIFRASSTLEGEVSNEAKEGTGRLSVSKVANQTSS